MAADVDIVNRALSKLGETPITSLGDPVKAAKLAASLYGIVRDDVITSHTWNFAKTRVMLPAEAKTPDFGWKYQYLLPSDNLRVMEAGPWPQAVMDDYIGGERRSFVLEGGLLLTNHGPALNLIYLRRVTDVGLYPPSFIEALACKLAVEMCAALTDSNSKREMAWREYDMAIKQARRNNAIGLPPQPVQDDTWMVAHQWGVI